MKITELVDKLLEIAKREGNLDVLLHDTMTGKNPPEIEVEEGKVILA